MDASSRDPYLRVKQMLESVQKRQFSSVIGCFRTKEDDGVYLASPDVRSRFEKRIMFICRYQNLFAFIQNGKPNTYCSSNNPF